MSPLGSSLTILFISPRTSFTHLGIMQKPQPGFGCLRMCFILLFSSVPFPSLPLHFLPSLLPSLLPCFLPFFLLSCPCSLCHVIFSPKYNDKWHFLTYVSFFQALYTFQNISLVFSLDLLYQSPRNKTEQPFLQLINRKPKEVT